ncbi:MAG: DUF6680 family protein [Burkholderiales bacterium]
MTVSDWIMIGAILLGPIIAVRLTRFLDDRKEVRERKIRIFKTLMATMAYSLGTSLYKLSVDGNLEIVSIDEHKNHILPNAAFNIPHNKAN